jgi:hypothetical protein
LKSETNLGLGDRGFISKGLYLIGIMVHLLLLKVTQGSVILIIFVFILIVFFLLILMIIVVVMVVVLVVMVVIVAIILRQQLSFFRSFLSVFSTGTITTISKGSSS